MMRPEKRLNGTVPSRVAALGVVTLAALAGLNLVSCGDRPSGVGESRATAPLSKGEGVRRMAARLEELVRTLNPIDNQFLNAKRAAFLRKMIERSTNPAQKVVLTTNLADELLKSGKIQEAIDVIKPFLEPSLTTPGGGPSRDDVVEFLVLCYMRLGELENCIVRHNEYACLLPIRADGVHTDQRGSRAAIELLLEILRSDPDNPGARWLINIAHMTLGEYPDGVDERWLIPPETFAPEYDVGRFPNVAPRIGLDIRSAAGGGIMEDFDGDGLLDLMVSSMLPGHQMRYFRNMGDGTFDERTEEAGLLGETGGLNMTHADYNNDGHPDVLVLRGGWMRIGGKFPNSLLRNNGDGTFDDVTEEAGLLDFHPTQTATWGDYDNDGWLDLFIGNESAKDDPNPCTLYHNNGDGTFTDTTVSIGGGALGYVKGVAWGDFNNDGLQDLYVSVLKGQNHLFRNDGPRRWWQWGDGDWRFTDVAREAGVVDPDYSFPVWFWDYDNDGWLDILAAAFTTIVWEKPCRLVDCVGRVAEMYLGEEHQIEMPRLYRNNGDGTFADVTSEARLDRVALPMGSNFGDIDNDGWPDAYFATGEPSLGTLIPNQLFRNDRGRVFQDVTTSADVGHLQKGHGVAFGDIDNDGDQDLFEELGGFFEVDTANSALFENPGHGNHWITLRFEGRRSNRMALGTRIRVRVRETGGTRDIHAIVGTGGSFGGNSLQQEIGLGLAEAIESIEVVWPATGEVQVFEDVVMDRFYKIVESEPVLIPVEVKRFSF